MSTRQQPYEAGESSPGLDWFLEQVRQSGRPYTLTDTSVLIEGVRVLRVHIKQDAPKAYANLRRVLQVSGATVPDTTFQQKSEALSWRSAGYGASHFDSGGRHIGDKSG